MTFTSLHQKISLKFQFSPILSNSAATATTRDQVRNNWRLIGNFVEELLDDKVSMQVRIIPDTVYE